MLEELEEFEHHGQTYSISNPGWTKNGRAAYEIEDEAGKLVGTIFVSPLETLEEALAQWKTENLT